jgi:hypothetical protein
MTHRRKLLLLSLITIVLAVLTAIVLMVQQSSGASTIPVNRSAPVSVPSAKRAHERLRGWMEGWAEDAQLVTASLSLVKDEEGVAPWSFLVTSRRKKRIAVVTVVESELMVLREQHAVYPQEGVDPGTWTLDSDEVLDRWWDRGGHEAWTTPEARSLHLRLGTEANGVVWRVSVLDAYGNPIDFWVMRADSGESLPD